MENRSYDIFINTIGIHYWRPRNELTHDCAVVIVAVAVTAAFACFMIQRNASKPPSNNEKVEAIRCYNKLLDRKRLRRT